MSQGASDRAERTVSEGGREYAGFYLPSSVRNRSHKMPTRYAQLKRLYRPVSRLQMLLRTAIGLYIPRQRLLNIGDGLQQHLERLRALNQSSIPCGYGARICLGKAFATIRTKIANCLFQGDLIGYETGWYTRCCPERPQV